MSDEEFFQLYDAYDRPSVQDIVDKITGSEDELAEIVDYLIRRRDQLRVNNLEKLEEESNQLLQLLKKNQIKSLLELIAAFKETMTLQNHLNAKLGSEKDADNSGKNNDL